MFFLSGFDIYLMLHIYIYIYLIYCLVAFYFIFCNKSLDINKFKNLLPEFPFLKKLVKV